MRPASAVSGGAGIAGLTGLLCWFAVARWVGMAGPLAALTSTIACGLPMILWSLLIDTVHRRASTGIDWHHPRAIAATYRDSLVKIAGLWATYAIIAIVYGLLRYYWQGQYLWAMAVLGWVVGPLALLSVPYVLWIDRCLVTPRDGAWAFGHWLLGGADASAEAIFAHWRAWAVKGFFLAFMLSVVPVNFAVLFADPLPVILADPGRMALWAINFLFMIDVHFATVGYVLTMRPLDAHIRSANPYGLAWVAALICYPPFVLMNQGNLLDYHAGTAEWHVWLAGHPTLLGLWGAGLVVLTAIYCWATVAFGPRFSNLTHRGIITHGPYRWTRHPAYVSKNAFWWLSSLTILPWDGSMTTALRNTAMMALVSGVYYWRAKTEEKHLLEDPAYRAYWNWAQAHALVPRLVRRFTGLVRPVVTMQPDPARVQPD